MRILITTFTYPPNKDGVAEASRIMAEGLAELNWEVSVATQRADGEAGRSHAGVERENGVTVVRFDLNQYHTTTPGRETEIRRYQDFLRGGRFDVIVNQCWDAWPTTLAYPLFDEIKGAKVMVSHGYNLHAYHWVRKLTLGLGVWFRGLRWTASRLPKMIGDYDRLIFLSEKCGWGRFFDHTVANWLNHPGIEVVPNSTDPGLISCDDEGFRTRWGIGLGPMVLCVANYCERKNQKLAVRAYRQANVPGSTLVFIGSELEEYANEARLLDQQLARDSGACRVIFLEKLTRAETFAAFKATDVVLLTAKAETQPIVLIEAMAAGKPWISTDTGCVDRMEGGIVCRNQSALATALQRLMADPALGVSLGAEGFRAARTKYNSRKCVIKYDRIFRELTARHSSSSSVNGPACG